MLKRESDGSLIELKDGYKISKEITTFNAIGKHLEWIRFDDDSSIIEIRTWQFDRQNKIIEWNYFNSDRSLNYQETCKYDDNGNRTEFIGKEGNEYFVFNTDNQELSWHFYEKDSTLRFKRLREFDNLGNKISEIYIYKDKEVRTEYTYDIENRLIQEIGGAMNFKTIFKYSLDNRVINEIVYNELGELISNCFNEYDEFGNLVKETYVT